MRNHNYIPSVIRFSWAACILVVVSLHVSAQGITLSFTTSGYSGYNISCHGASDGTIQPTVAGGTAPYSFVWSTGDTVKDLSNLPAGTYILTVTDSLNATATDSVILTEPNPLSVLLTSPLCHTSPDYNICNPGQDAGTIYSTITGGAGGYIYSWNIGDQNATLTNAPAGSYTLRITDNNGCIDTGHITTHEPAFVRIAKSKAISTGTGHSSCVGRPAVINLTPEGGIPPYSSVVYSTVPYTVVNSYDSSGTEIFIVPENVTSISIGLLDAAGNEVDTTISLNPAPLITVNVTPLVYANGYNVSCHYCTDGSIAISAANGTAPYTYQWYNSNNSLVGTADTISNIANESYHAIITDADGCRANSKPITIERPAYIPFQLAMNGMDVNCHGDSTGSVSLNVSGGTPPYSSYRWSNGATSQNISNIPAGTYTVTVFDARNDSATNSIYVSEPTSIGIAFSNSIYNGGYNISVNGGSDGVINPVITGGTGNYQSYNWSKNGSQVYMSYNLAAGIYTLTVTDGVGCTASASDTLAETPKLLVSSVNIPQFNGGYNTLCKGSSDGSIHLLMHGGVQPYYANFYRRTMNGGSWYVSGDSDSLTLASIPAGTYDIRIYDANGAEFDTTIDVTEPPDAVSAEIIKSVYNTIINVSCFYCADGAMKINASGGIPPYSYQWYNAGDSLIGTIDSVGNLSGGNYHAVVTDANGCSYNSGTVTINQPAYIPLRLTMTSTPTICRNDATGSVSISLTGGTPPYSIFRWSNGATTQNLTGVTSGTYSVTVYDAQNTGDSTTGSITVSEPSAMNIILGKSQRGGGYNISAHGGSDGEIYCTVTGGTAPYETYNWSTGSREAFMQGLQAGIYSLTVTDGAGCTASASDTLVEPTPLHIDSILASTYNGGYNVSCHGSSDGSIRLAVSGGVPALDGGMPVYNYTWSNDQGYFWNTRTPQNAPAGHYGVHISDAYGSTLDTSITLTEPDALSLFLVTSVYAGNYNVSCAGCTDGFIKDSLTGGAAPYTQQWYDGSWNPVGTTNPLSNRNAGYYNVTVTDANGCQASANTWLSESPREDWRLGGNANTNAATNFIGTTDNTDFVVRTNNVPAVSVKANGNVGLGSVTPEYKLDVCGTIRSKEVLVEDSNWCDFVFDENYQRMGILEKENFLKENKHLPYISPAKDVAQNGLKVGNTLNGVTQNVEELNLDMIELFKKLENLAKENASLKERIAALEQKNNK